MEQGQTVFSSKDDTLETIYEKISSQNLPVLKLGVYHLFKTTRPDIIWEINTYIMLKDPELWKEIKKEFYPSWLDKVKSKIKSFFN